MRVRPHPLRLQVDSRHLAGCPCLVFKNERKRAKGGLRAGRDGKERRESGEREDKKAQEKPESTAAAIAAATKKLGT